MIFTGCQYSVFVKILYEISGIKVSNRLDCIAFSGLDSVEVIFWTDKGRKTCK